MALSKNENEIYDLLIRFFENDINDEQREKLLVWSQSVPNASKVYWRFAKDLAIIRTQIAGQIQIADDASEDTKFDQGIWLELAEYEKTAQAIEIPKEKPSRELIQKVVYPTKDKRKLSTFSKVFLALNAAAILFFFLLLRIAPPNGGREVATLTDSINAKWAGAAGSMEKGTRLATRSELFLRQGLTEVIFDNNAKVVVEGPAEFELLAEDRIDLRYGRIYVTVPREAIGFTIDTLTSRIIDLGTEFGVLAEPSGDMYLHVIKGKTTLISGNKLNKVSWEVTAEQAKKLSGITQEVIDTPFRQDIFARDIDSDKHFIWRGQYELSLASMIGGGDGFTQGEIINGIDPATGNVHANMIQQERSSGNSSYQPVPEREFIDGVFVPSSISGAIPVNSAGQTFEFSDANGDYFSDITANPYVLRVGSGTSKLYSVSLHQNPSENSVSQSLVLVHPNAGITFDLNKIRQSLPDLEIEHFKTTCGVSKSEDNIYRSEFWVLLDGVCVFHHVFDNINSEPVELDLPIAPNQKFLTLVTTDGGDGYKMDWCVFDHPMLHLKTIQ